MCCSIYFINRSKGILSELWAVCKHLCSKFYCIVTWTIFFHSGIMRKGKILSCIKHKLKKKLIDTSEKEEIRSLCIFSSLCVELPQSWFRWPVCLWPFSLLRGMYFDYHLPLCSGQHGPCFVVTLSSNWCRRQKPMFLTVGSSVMLTTEPYFTLPLHYPIPRQCRCLHLNKVHGVSACAMLAVGQPVWFWKHPCSLGLLLCSPGAGCDPGVGWQSPKAEGAASCMPTCMASTMRASCLGLWCQQHPAIFTGSLVIVGI